MIEIRPFHPADLGAMRIQPAQRPDLAMAGDAAAFALHVARGGPAFSAWAGQDVLTCAGLIENHRGYATAWALLADAKGLAFVAISRAVRRVLDAASYGRIDTAVRTDFEAGHRWAMWLGFSREGRMSAWGHDGSDWDLYARKGGMA